MTLDFLVGAASGAAPAIAATAVITSGVIRRRAAIDPLTGIPGRSGIPAWSAWYDEVSTEVNVPGYRARHARVQTGQRHLRSRRRRRGSSSRGAAGCALLARSRAV